MPRLIQERPQEEKKEEEEGRARGLVGLRGRLESKISGASLEQNANISNSHTFHCMFMKVRAPGAAIYINLERSLGSGAASDNHRPTINTARTPTAQAVWGIN